MAVARFLATTALLAAVATLAHGAAAPMLPPAPQPRLLAAEAPRLEPGVVVTFTSAATGKKDVRRDRLIALAVPAGTPPSSLLPAGTIRADWEANLSVPLRDEYSFSFQGSGTATLMVNGQAVLTESGPALGEKPAVPVVLNKGANRIQIAYTSPAANSDASFRLYWSGKGFGAEPVPPSVLSADMAGIPLRTSNRVREGRELFANLHCASCHDAGPANPAGMPELLDRAPSLADAGTRFRREWIASWILDPKSHRSDTLMPKVRLNAPQDAQDIAAYLASLGSAPAAPPPEAIALVNGGGRLFAELRCIACHTGPGSTPAAGGPARVSLGSVREKWQPAALTAYLQAPQKNHPAARMPDFRLSASEARQLTAFLLAGPRPGPAALPGNTERGRTQFAANCLACHGPAGPGIATSAPAAPTPASLRVLLGRDWTRGCLAESPAAAGTAPDFGLNATQRDHLRAFAAAGADTLAQDAPVEFARRQLVALNCAACHDRDNHAAGFTAFAEEAHALAKRSGAVETEGEGQSLSQDPPPLTWAGEKLKTDAILRLLTGNQTEPARPWLKAKMPAFGARADGLARGLALEHGLLPGPAPTAPVDPDLAALGERLAGPEFFGCVACHAAGSTPAAAPFGAPGINFSLVPGRLRDEYYRRWLDHPQRIEPQTKMPRFTGETGRSLQTEILDGNAHAQWDALLAYLTQLANP